MNRYTKFVFWLIVLALCAGPETRADTKISALPAGTTLAGTEAIPTVQSAATVKTTPAAINTYVQANTPTVTVAKGGTGAVTLTGPLKGNGTSAFSAALAADIYGLWSGTCNASSFLRGDGACATGNVGTVTSVALTAPGIFSVTGSPVTTSGTFAIAASGTSGGIPYFSGSTTLASSAALGANAVVLGAGAASAPVTDADFAWAPTTNIMSIGSSATPATIKPPAVTAAAGTSLTISAGDANGGNRAGGDLTLSAGALTGTGGAGNHGRIFLKAAGGTEGIFTLNSNDALWDVTQNIDSIIGTTNSNAGTDAQATITAANDMSAGNVIGVTSSGFSAGSVFTGSPAGAFTYHQYLSPHYYVSDNDIINSIHDGAANVIISPNTHAVGDTNGYLYIPKVAGLPTGVPANLTGIYANTAPVRIDSTNNQECYYTAAWHCAPMLDATTVTWTGTGTTTFGGIVSAPRVSVSGTSAPTVGIYRPGTNRLGFACNSVECGEFDATGQFIITTVGKGLSVKEGSNAKMGVSTLVAGTVVVSTTAVTASSRIFLTEQTLGTVTVPSAVSVSARTAGTSFTILASALTDTSTVAWMIVEPSP